MKWKLNKKLSRDCLSTFFHFFPYKNPFALLLMEASWLRYRHVLMWLAPWFLGEQQLGKAISNPSRQKGNAKPIESIQAFDITSQGPMGHAASTNFVFAFTYYSTRIPPWSISRGFIFSAKTLQKVFLFNTGYWMEILSKGPFTFWTATRRVIRAYFWSFCPKLNFQKMSKLNFKTPKLNLKILKLNLETAKL